MLADQLRYLSGVGRFGLVRVAYELRRDYERGVFSRQTVTMVGCLLAGGPILLYTGAVGLTIVSVGLAAWMTYTVARADRRWRAHHPDP
ncbi:hypothetical protein [Natronolimnobius baerhuensis]|uniref:Uncharacterized protein n=1 Tax=Natronolimnobius baerhuensis TaxID=253108 RepID=A0A202E926_9EURY|nr:hypothetical protein [Natronolimnobius baerhuensis]OVE84724.1 hypothetical protein B2G88_10090 [Natronolimnobius baerhuensis]